LLRKKSVSAREVMSAHLAQIERINPKVNAIVTLAAEHAMKEADRADEKAARGDELGVLHGLPIAHKDLVDTAGIRTTRGSPFYRDNVPTNDAEIVRRTSEAGAITCGKSNTPEFGAGSQTFNTVFGATRNPYDLSKTCGGSSGGAAVTLACGMSPLAGGSDTGGSLRNPAAFCNVVGLRPSAPVLDSRPSLSVGGPMARSVADVALFLSVLAGPNESSPENSPRAVAERAARLRGPLDRDFKGTRIAWWKGLGGIPFEREIVSVVNSTRRVFENFGCIVEEAEPDFRGVDEAFPTLRYTSNYGQYSALIKQNADWVKDTIKYEVAEAERRTPEDVARAQARHARMYKESAEFFKRYDYFVLPVTQVSPFDVNTPYPKEIAGKPMRSYIDWMRSCWYISFMGNPAISIPAGFTATGLPIGIQIVGRHNDDLSVLQIAHAFEGATKYGLKRAKLLSA
jgi:amidase